MDVATNAEKQSYLLQRIQNEEAARHKKQLLVRRGVLLCGAPLIFKKRVPSSSSPVCAAAAHAPLQHD